MPPFEIVDNRIINWKINLANTIADNASSGRVVLGMRIFPLTGLDLRLIGMTLEKNGELVRSGTGAQVYGHPAAAVGDVFTLCFDGLGSLNLKFV